MGKKMTYYETLLQINDKIRENIEKIQSHEKMDEINNCISYTEDIDLWLSCCGDFKDYMLVKESKAECIKSVFFCAQGFYKEAVMILRQSLEHLMFAILLSTNDYNYRLWKKGKYDMSWTQIVDTQRGIFSKEYIRCYAADIDDNRSMELQTIAKNVYRECSEYVHGNYEKLILLSDMLEFSGSLFDKYMEIFESVRYLMNISLLIRFREILNEQEILEKLEDVLVDNLGELPEVQMLYNREV